MIWSKWKKKAENLQSDAFVLYLARNDPRVPWFAKALAVALAAYAVSPIDLIPDFIPVLGYLDDLIIIPLGVALVIKLIPDSVWLEYKKRASRELANKSKSRKVVAVIVCIWLLTLAWLAFAIFKLIGGIF